MKPIRNYFFTALAAVSFLFTALAAVSFLSSCSKDNDAQPQPQPQQPVTSNEIVLKNIEQPTILEDRFEDPNLPDYLVNETIGVDAPLTIKPGVVIAFAEDVSMVVNDQGALFATGDTAKTKKIRFIGKLPKTSFWSGLEFYSKNSNNIILNAEILHAGSIRKAESKKAALTVHDLGRLTLKNTTIAQSGGYGLFLREGAVLVNFSENIFSNNTEAPIRLAANLVPKLDAASVYTSNNGHNVIELMGSTVTGTSEVVWPAFNDRTPYRFAGFVSIQTGWKLLPGTTIEIATNDDLEIGNGYINAIGTPTQKIVITGVQKTAASWKGIRLYTNNSKNVMEHVEINYAGSDPMLASTKAAIAVSGPASLSIRNSVITNCGGYGIHAYGFDAVLNTDVETTNAFTSNALAPVFYDK